MYMLKQIISATFVFNDKIIFRLCIVHFCTKPKVIHSFFIDEQFLTKRTYLHHNIPSIVKAVSSPILALCMIKAYTAAWYKFNS
jgi:hypothetical protein